MPDPFDDDDRDFDLAKEDGWSNADLLAGRHRSGGRYLGSKDDLEPPDDAA